MQPSSSSVTKSSYPSPASSTSASGQFNTAPVPTPNGASIQVGTGTGGPVKDTQYPDHTEQLADTTTIVKRAKPNSESVALTSHGMTDNSMVSLQSGGAIPNVQDHSQRVNDFFTGCRTGNVNQIKVLLGELPEGEQKTSFIVQKNPYGETALMYAANHGHIDIMEELLAALPDDLHRKNFILEKDFMGGTALIFAADTNTGSAVDKLLAGLPDDQHRKDYILEKNLLGQTALMHAARWNSASTVEKLLAGLPQNRVREKHILEKDGSGVNALMHAAHSDGASIIGKLLAGLATNESRKNLIFDKDVDGGTVMMYAARFAGWQTVMYLLDSLPDAKDKDEVLRETDNAGQNAQWWAQRSRHVNTRGLLYATPNDEARALWKVFVDLRNAVNSYQPDAIKEEQIKALLNRLTPAERAQALLARDERDVTTLMVAVQESSLSVIKTLLDSLSPEHIDTVILATSKSLNTALTLSADERLDVLFVLLEKLSPGEIANAIVERTTADDSVLTLVARKGHINPFSRVWKLLGAQEREIALFEQNTAGRRFITEVAEWGYVHMLTDILRELRQDLAKAALVQTRHDGMSVLNGAALSGAAAIRSILNLFSPKDQLELINTRDRQGRTLYEVAHEYPKGPRPDLDWIAVKKDLDQLVWTGGHDLKTQ